MKYRIWISSWSFGICVLMIKPSLCAIETFKGHLPSKLAQQQLPQITSPPKVDGAALQKRADIATCAYVSGNVGQDNVDDLTSRVPMLTSHFDAASPLTCPLGYSCTVAGVDAGFWWTCCDDIQCVGEYTQCVTYGDNLCPGLDEQACSQIYTSYLQW